MDHQELSRAQESSQPQRTAHWRLAALALATLYGLEIAYALFWMWPLDPPDSWDVQSLVSTAAAGAVLSLPVVLVTAGVVAPGRIGTRFVVSSSLAVLSGYAIIVGSRRSEGAGSSGFAATVVATYLVFLLPVIVIKRLRRWMIVPAAPKGTLRQRQYGVPGLMLATACAATVAGLGRWVLPLASWPGTDGPWGSLAMEMSILSCTIAWTCLPVIPFTPLMLGVERRANLLVVSLAVVAVAFGGLYFILMQVNDTRHIHAYIMLLCGAYISTLLYLLVIRACGFRLVRAGQANGVQERVAADLN
jgi:hypothetical protein